MTLFDAPAGVGLLGFIRIATRQVIFAKPLAVEDALRLVDGWLGTLGAQVLSPGARHAGSLGRLLLGAGTAGNLTNDAH